MTRQNRRTFLKTTTGGMTAMALSPLLDPVFAAPLAAEHRVGVIGLGRQGRAIMSELATMSGITVAAVCDIDESRLNAGVQRAPGAAPYSTHNELLEKDRDIEAVIISTPTHTHRSVAVDAIESGRHVYCESPLASTIEDCHAIVKAARNTRKIVQVGMQGRSNPIYKLAWTFVRSGSIRNIVGMRGQHHRKTSWRSAANDPERDKALNWRLDPEMSIGLAGELGAQQFDVFHWYYNKYPVAVRGSGSVQFHKDGRTVPDTIACSLTFDDGSVLQYDATLANSYERTHELFFGTMGTVKLTWTHGWLFKEADAPTQGWEVYANRQQFHNEEGITLIADATQLAAQGRLKEGVGLPNTSLYYALQDFIRSIDEGHTPASTADEGMRAAIVGILANQAVVTGTEVRIDEGLLNI